jgi:uncharacterized protein (TIGR04222 family)
MNPFDLPGPEFLRLYLVVLCGAVVIAAGVRWLLRQPGGAPPAEDLDLSPYEIAYLAGGERLAIDAAIVKLIHLGALAIDALAGRLSSQGERLAATAHPLEKIIHHASDPVNGTRLSRVRETASTTAAGLRTRLEEGGLLLSKGQSNLLRLVPAGLVLGATLFGFIKIFVGLSRHRPVGYLVLLVLVSVAAAGFFFAWRPFRSRRGDRALRQLKHENAALEYAAGRRVRQLTDSDLILGLGLFGTGILAGGPLARLQTALKPPPVRQSGGSFFGGGSSCGGSTCGGGSSCGGGGCGGGCGGGGCGGCGSG